MLWRILCSAGCFAAALMAVAQAAGGTSPFLEPGVNPRDTSTNLQLGLELERLGNLNRSEAILLEAAGYDHQYQPAWTLANYYFRRNQTDQFWRWSLRAAELSYDDGRPLLRLAAAMENDPVALMNHLGRRPVLLRTYLDILIGQDRKDAARQVAAMLSEFHDPADQPRFDALAKRFEKTK